MLRARYLLLGLAALIVPACGGSQTVSTPLFQETFSGTFPGTAWTIVTAANGGAAAISATVGNPQPALNFKTTAINGTASTTTTGAFAAPGVTFTIQESVPIAGAGLNGAGTISIMDSSPAVVAFVTWDAATGNLTYSIMGSAIAPQTAPTDGAFHVFRFNVDSAGNATWSLDGVAKATHASFSPGNLKLQLSATFGAGTSWPEFNFDNITIMNP